LYCEQAVEAEAWMAWMEVQVQNHAIQTPLDAGRRCAPAHIQRCTITPQNGRP